MEAFYCTHVLTYKLVLLYNLQQELVCGF